MRPLAIDPAELRPRRRWYWIAGGIVVLFCVLGGVGFAAGISSTLHQIPRHRAYFTTGDEIRSTLSTGTTWAVYTDIGVAAATPGELRCTVTGRTGEVHVRTASFPTTITEGDRVWSADVTFTVPRDGRYTVSCDSPDGAGHDRLMLGTTFQVGGFIGGILGGFAALFGLPALGLVIGAIIATIVAVRRSGHRKRLLYQRYGPPPGPYGWPAAGRPPHGA